MGLWTRFSTVFRAKANKALDKAEDPREMLDYSYERQLELLGKVRRGVADVATSRKRVEMQLHQLGQQADKLEQQGRQALAMGREDLAREALTRRSGVQGEMTQMQAQLAQLQADEERLVAASKTLQARVDSFRTRKESIKASYTAAEAQTKINEAFSGMSKEMGDIGSTIQRAEDKTQQLQARSAAIDELIASGALDDASGWGRDDVTAELERLSSDAQVEADLARLKGEIGAAPTTPAVEAAPSSGTQPTQQTNDAAAQAQPHPASDERPPA